MGLLELILLAISLSMDAFAVAICKGLQMRQPSWKQGLIIAFFFGFFQAAMPLAGWAIGHQLNQYMAALDHWIAFVLLSIIGGKMVYEALGHEAESQVADPRLNMRELLLLAVATSIDALAVGVTFAFLQVRILPSVALIGATTFAISLAGVRIGNRFGGKLMKKAGIAGGATLVLIGAKILLEHLLAG